MALLCVFCLQFGSAVDVNRYIQLSADLLKDRGAPFASETSRFSLRWKHEV